MMSKETNEPAEQALSDLAEQFAHWRRTRPNAHARIPQPLWDQAIALSRVLSDSKVAKRLRLSQTDLKKRRLAQPASAPLPAPPAPMTFVELTPALAWPGASSGPLVVEFDRPDGARMRLRYPQSPPLAALVDAFLEQR
jgi:hypothetical protein